MDLRDIFLLQLGLSLIVIALLFAWYLRPWLRDKPYDTALILLIAPHTFRHIGMAFQAPGVVSPSMPANFANSAGYGDLAAGLWALLAIIALRLNWPFKLGFVWLFSFVGIADLANALRHTEAIAHMGAMWFVPTFFVPLLLITHVMVVARLLRGSVPTPVHPTAP